MTNLNEYRKKVKSNHKVLWIYAGLIAVIIAVYWPVYKYDFIKYDDDAYVINNTNIQHGFDLQTIKWAFSTGHFGNYFPVTWLSHTLDFLLFKNWAGGSHVVNVLFHIVNTILLFYFFVRTTSALWPSAFIAAAFALHPMHVESVAWISERKDVLSSFFWLLTMLMYAEYVKELRYKWYAAVLIFFILGLMSKAMLVTVPFILLLADYWPLQRKWNKRIVLEKIPFFLVSIIFSIITLLIPLQQKTLELGNVFSLKLKIYNALVAYINYILKMIWPSRLAILYPHPVNIPVVSVVISTAVLIVLSAIFIYYARRYRFLIVGWLWFVVTLVPVIGIIKTGQFQAMADRYSYMSLVGLFIIVVFGANELTANMAKQKILMGFLSVAALAGMMFGAVNQLRYWKNSITLFEHTLAVTKNNVVILNNYIICLNEQGRYDEVIEQSQKLIGLKPDSFDAFSNMGIALAQTGRLTEALECFKKAVEYKPDDALAYFNLGLTEQNLNQKPQAVEYYRKVLQFEPNNLPANVNLASLLMEMGNSKEAAEVTHNALQYFPKDENLNAIVNELTKMESEK